jgi:hypothetical protein
VHVLSIMGCELSLPFGFSVHSLTSTVLLPPAKPSTRFQLSRVGQVSSYKSPVKPGRTSFQLSRVVKFSSYKYPVKPGSRTLHSRHSSDKKTSLRHTTFKLGLPLRRRLRAHQQVSVYTSEASVKTPKDVPRRADPVQYIGVNPPHPILCSTVLSENHTLCSTAVWILSPSS